MKIRLERDVMAEAVAWAARSLPMRPPVPILSGLLINASGDTVTLSSFDYETSAKVTIGAEVSEAGEVLVPGRLLAEIARSLPSRTVEITGDEHHVELVCGASRFTLQPLPVADYPTLPDMPAATGRVNATAFANAVAQVVVAAGRDELLPVFTGVRVEIEGDQLSMLATDRYRMALEEFSWTPESTSTEGTALVPAKVLSEVAKSMSGGDEIILSLSGHSVGDGLIGFEGEGPGGHRQITTRLLDGEFPKVRHLMDVEPTITVRVKNDELIAAVKRVALVAEKNTPLRILIDDDHLALEAATGDQAQGSEAIEAVITDMQPGERAISAVGFNPTYLQDALNVFDTPYVHFSFTQPGKPSLIMGLSDIDGNPEQTYKHVIMLMRLPS